MDHREIARLKSQVLSSRGRLLKGKASRRKSQSGSLESRLRPERESLRFFESLAMKDYEQYERRSLFENSNQAKRYDFGSEAGNLSTNDDLGSRDSRLFALNAHRKMSSADLQRQIPLGDVTVGSLLQASLRELRGLENSAEPFESFNRKKNKVYKEPENADVAPLIPSEDFLAGSLWLGKHSLSCLERLVDDVAFLREETLEAFLKQRDEVSVGSASNVNDHKTVNLLRNGLQDALTIVQTCCADVRSCIHVRRL